VGVFSEPTVPFLSSGICLYSACEESDLVQKVQVPDFVHQSWLYKTRIGSVAEAVNQIRFSNTVNVFHGK
jgi:hypothetical protein